MTSKSVYKVTWTDTAVKLLEAIPDKRVRKVIHTRAGQLDHNPEQQGYPLLGELSGYRSVRAGVQRYRVIYRVDRDAVLVYIVVVGRRKQGDRNDVYALAQKLLKQGLVK